MGKNKNKHKQAILMRDWPEDETSSVDYHALIYPLKKIMHDGYKLERYPVTQFVYKGYNIGKEERAVYFPTPEERFSSRWLENEKKMDRTLLDNILITAFHLGMEHGRRISNKQRYPNTLLESIVEARSCTIRKLRERLSVYEPDAHGFVVPMENEDDELLIDNMLLSEDSVDVEA